MSDEYIKKIVYWDQIEKTGVEEYDEAFLAALRSELKLLDSEDSNILIVPMRFSGEGAFWGCFDLEVMNEETEKELFETFTASFLHLARRIKDCKSVVGFEYPDFSADWDVLQHYSQDYKEKFMAAFQKKHSHYIFVS